MEFLPETRLTLIKKLKDYHDNEAWEEFIAIYQPLVFRFCNSKGLQHADAVDVTQEVMSRVSSVIDQYDSGRPGATFRGWLYRISRNLLIDYFRQKGKNSLIQFQGEIEAIVSWEPEEEESKEFQMEFRKQVFAMTIKQVREKVSKRTWSAFWETEFGRRSVEEVAEELEMTSGAIYVARSRVLAKLKMAADALLKKIGQGESFGDWKGVDTK